MSVERAPTDSQAARPHRLRRLLGVARLHRDRWSDERELAHAIHGTVVGAAAMAAASLHGTLRDVIVTVLVTVAVYWAAERYAEVLAAAVKGPGRLRRVRGAVRQGWPMIEAAYTPLVVLIVFVVISGELQGGVFAALGVSTLMLGGLGHAAARRAGTSRGSAFLWGAVSAMLGIIVMVLKVSLH